MYYYFCPQKLINSGKNDKLGLSGRKNRDIGILTTSKLYKIQDKIFAFTPQVFSFYIF